MPKLRFLLALAAIALLAPGCFLSRPRYLNWQKSIKPVDLCACEMERRVRVQGFAFDVEVDEKRTRNLWDLSPQGQAAYIKQLGGKAPKGEDLIGQLRFPLSEEKHTTVHDLTKFKKRIVLSVDHVTDQPADRISRLDIRIKLLKENEFKFKSWDRVATQYSSIDLGTMTATSTTSFTLSPSLELMGDAVGTSAGEVKYERGMTEEIKLSRRYVEMNGRMSDNTAELILQGMPTRDLAGNIVAIVQMEADDNLTEQVQVFDFNGSFAKSDAPVDSVKYHQHVIKTPLFRDDVRVSINYDAWVREVRGGGSTIPEGDDHVRLLKGENMKADEFVLVNTEEMTPKSWVIVWNEDEPEDPFTDTLDQDCKVYFRRDSTQTPQLLQILDRSGAEALLTWLEARKDLVVRFKRMELCWHNGDPIDFPQRTANSQRYILANGELDWFADPFEPSDLDDPFAPTNGYDPFERR